MSMVNPYEGMPEAPKKPRSYWVVSYTYADNSSSGVVGVYSSEDKAMAGAVKFMRKNGWPSIEDFKFTAFELNAVGPAPGVSVSV